jgi:hypothetical protein
MVSDAVADAASVGERPRRHFAFNILHSVLPFHFGKTARMEGGAKRSIQNIVRSRRCQRRRVRPERAVRCCGTFSSAGNGKPAVALFGATAHLPERPAVLPAFSICDGEADGLESALVTCW